MQFKIHRNMRMYFTTLALLALCVCDVVCAREIPADTPLSELLSTAQIHLSKGRTADALDYFDAAIGKDPQNYLAYFKRATTFLSLGRSQQAADDFNEVLRIKPGFEGAHLQLGKIRAQTGDWDGAEKEYQAAGKRDGEEMRKLHEAKAAAVAAVAAEKQKDWKNCVQQATSVISVANKALYIRELRAQCNMQMGEMYAAINDLQHVLQLRPSDVQPHLRIAATQFYAMGDFEQGLTQVRKCLMSDPDNKACSQLLKKMKGLKNMLDRTEKLFVKGHFSSGAKNLVPSVDGSERGLIAEVSDQIEQLKKHELIAPTAPNLTIGKLLGMACKAYFSVSGTSKPRGSRMYMYAQTLTPIQSNSRNKSDEYCPKALEINPEFLYGLLHRGKKQLGDELYDAALKTFEEAKNIANDNEKATVDQLIKDAQIALRQSKNKDYYKILGVARDADNRQIKSAFRKLSKQYHPDKAHSHGLNKETAEKKMAEINQAYEYLSNPEERQKIDRGEDPANPHGGGHPFQGGPGAPFSPEFAHMFQGSGGPQFSFQFGGPGGFRGGPFGR